MYNENRWNERRARHHDRDDQYRNEYRDDRGWEGQHGYDRNEWSGGRSGSGYERDASRSGYGSSMSSQGGGHGDTGSFYNDQEGYMHQSRYADYGSDYRRYTDNYYRDRRWDRERDDRQREPTYHESRMFNERMRQAPKGQSYDSAYGSGGRGAHMGYGEKGAQYRDDFHGQYGGWSESDRVRNRDHYRNIGNPMGSDSYFVNTRDEAYREGRDQWNIGNYGERGSNDQGYGYGRSGRNELNRNDQNYTW